MKAYQNRNNILPSPYYLIILFLQLNKAYLGCLIFLHNKQIYKNVL